MPSRKRPSRPIIKKTTVIVPRGRGGRKYPLIRPVKKYKSYPMVSAIKKVVGAMSEKKIALPLNYTNQQMNVYDASTPAAPTILSVHNALAISQGTGQGERIGNSISVKSHIFQGYVQYGVPNSGGNPRLEPLDVTLIIARLKSSIRLPDTADFQALYQNGNTSLPPQNTLIDNIRYFNKDDWRIMTKRRFRLQLPTLGLGGPPNTSSKTFADPRYTSTKKFKINLAKYYPKIVKYNDTTTTPTNVGVYAFVVAGYSDGFVLDDASTVIQLTADSTVKFTDL